MPTSYTSLIGLALPVTGELSGTWGDTVNNYITQYVDAAIAGVQTISGSQTAVTLSVTNGSSLVTVGSGATGSAQFQIINCTGNPASLLTITAPASSRQYIVINATSTAQSVKLVGTGPTTGVTMVSGEKAHVAWNGTDFVKVSSDINGIAATISTAAPNATVNVSSITPQTSTVDADLALVTKGAGAILAQVPTATSAGGNKRGQYAVDFQLSRITAAQVASGDFSLVIGGSSHQASNSYASVVGGYSSTASGQYSGCFNAYSSTASGQYSGCFNSFLSLATGSFATVIGGSSNTAGGVVTIVVGGTQNQTSADYTAVIGGAYGTDRGIKGIVVMPASIRPIAASLGASQTALLVLGASTGNATPKRLASDNNAVAADNQLILANNAATYFRGSVIANVTGGGDTKSWTFDGQIKRGANAAATTLTGSTITSPYADAGASAWTIALTADTTLGGLAVTVTGQASTTIRWVCKLETTEVAY